MFRSCLLLAVIGWMWLFGLSSPAAMAAIDKDTFDGNIFALYGGNGSLVPPRISFPNSLQQDRATLLIFYLDDSRDCKQYTTVVSQLQAYYGRIVDFVPLSVDQIIFDSPDDSTSPAYYYRGQIPQTIIFDRQGNRIFDEVGRIPFETVDTALRELFDFPPRENSTPRIPKAVNELNLELTQN
ncbi:thylakoid membrane photosystem I accumulation factor [Roseofilum sp. BLCC_M143]|uniref:Thylakoid membrane photosystem I accumulation factor n=1 Tax=Roseofilum casamattae BLCC-M143 TaxID=3022442 RepID=A0ABT7C1G3_9CYAN|nr:thylakoid membrane photosystem I accumulation factor [Roseofilum casamattae BLCC-M143]